MQGLSLESIQIMKNPALCRSTFYAPRRLNTYTTPTIIFHIKGYVNSICLCTDSYVKESAMNGIFLTIVKNVWDCVK